MNTNQVQSVFRKLLLLLAAWLVTKGQTAFSGFISDPETVSVLCWLVASACTAVSFWWSHRVHATPDTSPTVASSTPPLMAILFCFGLALAFTGCGSNPSRTAYNVELAAASTGDAGLQGYAAYWNKAIQNPTNYNRTVTGLLSEKAAVEDASIKTGASIALVEALRKSAVTNAAMYPALEAGVVTVIQNSSNEVSLVTRFISTTNH